MADPIPTTACLPVVLCDSSLVAPDNKIIAVVGLDGVVDYYSVAADGSTSPATPDPANLGVCPGPPPEIEYVPFDPTVHDPGVVEGDGNPGTPFQIPLPCCDTDHVNVGPADPVGDPGDGTHTYLQQPDPADPTTWVVWYWIDTDGDEVGDAWVAKPDCCDDDHVNVGPAAPAGPPGDGTHTYIEQPDPADDSTWILWYWVDSDGDEIGDSWVTKPECCDDDHVNIGGTAPAGDPGDGTHTYIEQPDPADPATWVVHYWIDTDGDEIGDAWVSVPACCDEFTYVPFDPAVHIDGAIEGDGSPGSPYEIPLPDPCAALINNDPIACETATSVLATDGTDCGPIALEDLIPKHIFGVCDSANLPTVLPTGAAGPVAHNFTSMFLGNGQIGEIVIGGANPGYNQYTAGIGNFPMSLPVPAHTAGCVLFLHLAYGGWGAGYSTNGTGFTGVNADLATGSDISNSTALGTQPIPSNSGSQYLSEHQVYAFDGLTGGGGSTVDVTVTGAPPGGEGVFAWNWIEVCDGGGPLTVADFDVAATQQTLTGSSSSAGQVQTSADWDLGECPAVMFAAGRHVASDPNDPSATNTPFTAQATDWFQASNPGVDELYDFNSLNGYGDCQMGWAAAFVDGGLGSWNWDKTSNEIHNHGAGGIAVPLKVCETASGSGATETQDACSVDLENTNCKDGLMKCCAEAVIILEVPAGEKVTVYPTVGGAVHSTAVAELDNTNGTFDIVEERSLSFCVTDFANLVTPGSTSTGDIGIEVTNQTGVGSATVKALHTECEIIHV